MLNPENLNGQAAKLVPRKIEAPEWGGDFYVASLSGSERLELEALWDPLSGQRRLFRAFFLAYGWCDENNERLVPPEKLEQVAEHLLTLSCAPLVRGFITFASLNCLLESQVADMAKNLPSAQTSDATGD